MIFGKDYIVFRGKRRGGECKFFQSLRGGSGKLYHDTTKILQPPPPPQVMNSDQSLSIQNFFLFSFLSVFSLFLHFHSNWYLVWFQAK